MKRSLFISIVFIVLIFLTEVFVSRRQEKEMPYIVQQVSVDEDKVKQQCFYRITTKTDEKLFSVEEYMRLEFDGENVKGNKFGFQDGPGYSNGYTGTLSGAKSQDELVLYYAYTVEGSSNTEQEIYKMTDGGIERIQYQLVEKDNILVPDRSLYVSNIPYTSFSCTDFDEKVPE